MNDPVSSSIRQIIELFSNELSQVRFGDLDAGVLSAAADEVTAAAQQVAEAEAVLEKARAVLAEKDDVLQQNAQRALAYARLYAQGHPALAEKLPVIVLSKTLGRRAGAKAEAEGAAPPSATTEQAPRRRGRKPKAVEAAAEAPATEVAAAEAPVAEIAAVAVPAPEAPATDGPAGEPVPDLPVREAGEAETPTEP